ncbi:MAG: hypothetical protein A2498_02140 [Lentisphaerae bacterium RIFOXYC12_FULL_60_16]|nr:MAG: hypothetical protein A2498_02140 [Lentisphaerae bacterium RIFOXYC12_FULL_60_16]OGV77830.1 MAG: hypothetical protein A2340_10065 [Lentisphaerae bacterium RIFOXYB12_FULL_60_10]
MNRVSREASTSPGRWLETLAFYAYALAVTPVVTPLLRDAVHEQGALPAAGWIIAAALVAETFAVWWLASSWRIRGGSPFAQGMSMRLGAGLVISHVLLAYFLLLGALSLWGLMGDGTEGDEPSILAPILFVVMFFREVVLWVGAAARRTVDREPPAWRLFLARWMMVAFQCIAFTVYWDAIIGFEGVDDIHPAAWLVLAPAIVLVFLILYLPLCLQELMEPCFRLENPGPEPGTGWRLIGSGACLALYPFALELIKTHVLLPF